MSGGCPQFWQRASNQPSTPIPPPSGDIVKEVSTTAVESSGTQSVPEVQLPSTPVESATQSPVTIQSGDTLGALGEKHGFDWRQSQIMRDGQVYEIGPDGIPPEKIRPGDQVIPGGGEVKSPVQDVEQAAEETGNDTEVEGTTSECSTCELITSSMLSSVFTNASSSELSAAASELNYSISVGKIDSHERISHFLGQCKHEGASKILVSESLIYSATALKTFFSFYKRNPDLAEEHGYTDSSNKSAADQEAIANNAYANRIGNGDADSGDGWKYRGRGIKQLTGRANYRQFTETHKEIWGDDVDFEENPDLISTEVKYAVRSALAFWVDNGLADIADGGVSKSVSNDITDVINPGEKNTSNGRNPNRWNYTNQVYSSNNFKEVCFNRTSDDENEQAKC